MHVFRQRFGLSLLAVTLLISAFALLTPTTAEAQSPCGDTVTVVRGDTLRGIARRCDVTYSELLAANPQIANPNLIYVGQQINIPQEGQPQPQPPAQSDISISPVSGPAGTVVQVAATGFPAQSEITFGIGPQGQAIETNRVVTGPQGMAETSLTVPDSVEAGQTLEIIAFVTQEDGVVEATADFTIASGEPEPAVPVEINPTNGPPGATIQVIASGLPANAIVEIGAGQINSEYDIIAQAQTDAQGNLDRSVRIPNLANPGEEWVIVVTPTGTPADYLSNSFTVTEPSGDGDQNLFTRTNIYLIALEDEGRSGMQIGCGDSVVPVEIEIEPTLAVLTAAMNALLDLDERFYGESGLYNALYNSNLNVESINLVDGQATINLTGDVSLGGVCDVPRFEAQLRQTALQYYTVDSVEITINGEPLEQAIR
jgi:LysM repeat protein